MKNRPLRSVNEKSEAQLMQIGDISPAQICRHLSYNYMTVFVSRWVVYLLDISRCLMFSGYSCFWLANNLGGQARISRMTSSAWCISRLTSLVPTKWRLLPRVACCDVSIRPYRIVWRRFHRILEKLSSTIFTFPMNWYVWTWYTFVTPWFLTWKREFIHA